MRIVNKMTFLRFEILIRILLRFCPLVSTYMCYEYQNILTRNNLKKLISRICPSGNQTRSNAHSANL